MIVQPTSTGPRGRSGRLLRLAGLVASPLLLVAVVGAGLAGPRPEGPETRAPAGSPAASQPGPGASDGPATPGTPNATAIVPDGTILAVPDVAAGLAVRGVVEAQALLSQADGRPLAVAGWLVNLRVDPGCEAAAGDTRGPRSPLCERTVRLEATPAARIDGTGGVAGNRFAHLHVRVPAGVRLPPPLESAGAEAAGPVAAVLVGRAETPDAACATQSRGCGQQFVADLVSWAVDGPFEPGVVFDAGLEVPPPAVAYRHQAEAEQLAIGRAGTVLLSAIVRPATLAEIDPEAAAALALAPRPKGLVWYVRGLETRYGPARIPPGDVPARVRWVVLDDSDGALVAIGISGGPRITAPAQ